MNNEAPKEMATRRFVPPFGWPVKCRVSTITPAEPMRWLVLNRYPRQVVGFALRLPDEETISGQIRHHALSILWCKPARWWTS